jgi:hypothetical protein
MQIREKLRPLLPHMVAVLVYLTISSVYFYPALDGKVLHTNDGTVARNSSQEIRDFRDKTGQEPLWTNAMFGGMPAYLISTRYPGNLMKYADSVIRFIKLPIGSIFLTMLGFYLLLLMFRVKPWLALAGGLAYGLSTYFFFILAAGHNTKAIAIAYMAPVIGGVYYTYRENAIRGALLTGFFLTLQIIANHPQITYYAFLCILIFIVFEFIQSLREKEISGFIRKSAILAIPVLLAVGMNFASLYTTYEYGKYSIRGKSDLVSDNKVYTSGLNKDYATQWSYGIDETLTLLIPDFKGGANMPFSNNSETVTALKKNGAAQYVSQFYKYWGTQPWTDGPVYVGAIVVFLFILGLILVKGHVKWWLLTATLLSIMLAWGKNFMPLTSLFMDYFPGYNKFRAVTMTLVIAEFCMPLLAIIALRDILEGKVSCKDLMKGLKIALGITGGITLLFVAFPGLSGNFISPNDPAQLPAWLSTALKADRHDMVRNDAFRSLVFILLAAAVLLGFYYERIKKEYAIFLLGLFFITDMFPVNKRYMKNDMFITPLASQKASAPTTADNEILKDQSDFRVLNLSVSPFNDATTSKYHKSIGGYHGAKMRRYNELIDSVLYPEMVRIGKATQQVNSMEEFQANFEPVIRNASGLNMLNTKYIILDPSIPPVVNNNALGNAWFADTSVIASGANEELSLTARIDPSKVAVVDAKFRNFLTASSYKSSPGDTIELTSYKPNELLYKYSSAGERLAVFSEIYYPAGWKAYIDGKENEHFRANYVLRAMVVPAGSHEIRFEFRPASYYTGNKISFASSVIFIVLVIGYFGRMLFVKKVREDGSSQ